MPRSAFQPEIHSRIAERLGQEEADKFCRLFGGREIYIPLNVTPNTRLAAGMGLVSATAISDIFGSGNLVVPLYTFGAVYRRRAMVLALLREGRSNAQIAEAAGVHTRTVTRIRRQLRTKGFWA